MRLLSVLAVVYQEEQEAVACTSPAVRWVATVQAAGGTRITSTKVTGLRRSSVCCGTAQCHQVKTACRRTMLQARIVISWCYPLCTLPLCALTSSVME